MRRTTDLPRSRPWSRLTGRAVLIGIGIIVFAVIVFGRAIANFYADALWHNALGRSDVFWGQLQAKATLFVLFFLVFAIVASVNLYVADRAAPTSFPANVHPYVERFHELFGHRLRLVRYGTALVLAFVLALPAVSQWQEWLLFRNSKSFGVDDPQFGVDVGFYVFDLPFLSFAIDWLFAALVIVLLLTIAAHLLNGGVLFASSMPTVRPATKVHVAVLLAVLASAKAADYWLTRYELTNETRGFVQGATYTVVKAQLPATMLLVLIALLTAVLYLTTIRTDRWRLPLVASGLWLVVMIVGGLIYPALVQSLIVKPNQGEREAPYIARNVDATRVAMDIGDVEPITIDFGRLTTAEVESDVEPLTDVRLLNPVEMKARFEFDEGQVSGLQIDDLDVDRYSLDGDEVEQVLVSARELDIDNIPNTSWQGRHLVSTRGCGIVMAPVSRVTSSFRPAYHDIELERPELYFSPALSGYAVARTDVTESDCGDGTPYQGTDGVEMSSFVRRASFALAFLDYNLIGSGAINDDSQLLWIRDVRDRVEKLAPFLSFDGDPYPVVVDGGVQWVIDGYTTSSRYPYAQRIGSVERRNSGLSTNDNYIRNSVKATVDAYTGEVVFYVNDEDDPILRAWRTAFPKLFTAGSAMPDEVRAHLRYPEDLFRVQTELYSKYQIPAEDFFERRGAWSVAQAPSVSPGEQLSAGGTADPAAVATEFATESGVARFTPYYTMFRNQVTGVEEFVLLRPFVPFSTNDARTQLQAFMTASSDPETYGRLTSHVLPGTDLPDGPLRVVSQAESAPALSQRIDRDENPDNRSRVRFGDLQLVPVADGLIWVRPYYVAIEGTDSSRNSSEYRFVIVSHNSESAFGRTLQEALAGIFPGFDADLGDVVTDGEPPTVDEFDDESDGPTPEPEPAPADRPELDDDATPAELLAEADRLFAEADSLPASELARYQELITEARALIQRALELIEADT